MNKLELRSLLADRSVDTPTGRIVRVLSERGALSAAQISRLTGLANTLVADLQLARSEAIKRNSTVRLCQSSDGATCANNANWGLGWLMSHTIGATTTTLNVQQPVLTGYLVTGPILPVDFRSTGGVGTPITFRICPSVATADGQGREITLSITGRPTVSATRTGLCS